LTLPLNGWAGTTSSIANGTTSAKGFFLITGQTQYLIMTSQRQTSLFTKDKSTSLQVGFLANHTAKQENGWEKKTNAIFGQKCFDQFEKLNRPGLWAKTFAALLIGQAGWYSTKCVLIWKLKGTKYNRSYFQLAVSTLRTEETEYGLLLTPIGLLPTPRTVDVEGGKVKNVKFVNGNFFRENKDGVRWGVKLRDIVENGLLPTPTAIDSTNATATMKSTQVKEGSMHSVTLTRAMAMALLPTPRANKVNGCNLNSEKLANRNKGNLEETVAMWNVSGMLPTPAAVNYKGASSTEALKNRGRLKKKADDLANQFHQPGKSSQLNPRFVAEMMGFPPNWTELPFQGGEANQSKPMEMQ